MPRSRVLAAAILTSLAVVLGCPTDPTSDSGSGSKDAGLTVTSGTFAWVVTAHVPLPSTGAGGSCVATASGTTTVGSDGTYSISFPALACSACTMTASTAGTLTSKAVNGTVTATITGSGCSSQQPTPSPAPESGTCNNTSCSVANPDGNSFSVAYTLTPG